jgi:hypothetical protein
MAQARMASTSCCLASATVAASPRNDWLMFSGAFLAGHVHRPAGGPRHDPHWILLGTSATECPDPRAGWANSIDEAKEDLQRAWQAWLDWAELGAPS